MGEPSFHSVRASAARSSSLQPALAAPFPWQPAPAAAPALPPRPCPHQAARCRSPAALPPPGPPQPGGLSPLQDPREVPGTWCGASRGAVLLLFLSAAPPSTRFAPQMRLSRFKDDMAVHLIFTSRHWEHGISNQRPGKKHSSDRRSC